MPGTTIEPLHQTLDKAMSFFVTALVSAKAITLF
jgi:hypothetical protein